MRAQHRGGPAAVLEGLLHGVDQDSRHGAGVVLVLVCGMDGWVRLVFDWLVFDGGCWAALFMRCLPTRIEGVRVLDVCALPWSLCVPRCWGGARFRVALLSHCAPFGSFFRFSRAFRLAVFAPP